MKTEPTEPMMKSDFGGYGSYGSPAHRYSPHQNLGAYTAYPYVTPPQVAVGNGNDYWPAWNQVKFSTF